MKRYLVFIYDSLYPCGGYEDFRESFNNFKDAKNFAKKNKFDNDRIQIVDIFSGDIVFVS